jgi:hypothetical protein
VEDGKIDGKNMFTKREVINLLKDKVCVDHAHVFDSDTVKKVDDITEGMICLCGQTYAHWIELENGHRFVVTIWRFKTYDNFI